MVAKPHRNGKVALPDQRASVGVALIAKDAEKTLGACLASIAPYVQQVIVCVDERTTDKTAKVARKHGAEVYPVQVSDWHECPQHGRVLAQDFAAARNVSFSHLRRDLDWWMWIDSDDVVEGAENLKDILAGTPPSCMGYWLPYEYGKTNGVVNTIFDRERLLRSSVGWEWRYRIHEVAVPMTEGMGYLRTERVKVIHQEGVHKSQSSASRNLLCLEIDDETTPNDARTLFYLGNQYFALAKWPEAVHWYERLQEVGKNPYELWQASCYLSHAYEQMKDLNGATMAAFAALDYKPEYPEPYFRLASIAMLAGENEKAEFWTKMGRGMVPHTIQIPPPFVFKNPLDYSFNNHVTLADAYIADSRVKAAREELEIAYQALPDKTVGERIVQYKAMERDAEHANALVRLLAGRDDAGITALWEMANPPESVREFGRVRDVVMPAYLRQRPNTQPRIVFLCGRALEQWYPGTLNTTGIGGSETAVIEIAKRFHADGWRVDVFNGAGRFEGVHDGVGYWEPTRWQAGPADVLVSWRNPRLAALTGRVNLLWCHDLNHGPDVMAGMQKPWSRVLGVSAWHAGMLRGYYDLPAERVGYVPNGIDLARFDPSIKKVPFQCVYTSSPDRDLMKLLRLWPKIIKDEPGATLKVAYGWDNIDKRIAHGDNGLAEFKANTLKMLAALPSVEWVGRLPQDKLAELYGASTAWLYPTTFLEVSCISAMEAMAGGCIPMTSAVGALPETIGYGGAVVTGNVYSRAWEDYYVNVVRGLLMDVGHRALLASAGALRASELTWDVSYQAHWKPMIAGLLEGRKEPDVEPARELAAVSS